MRRTLTLIVAAVTVALGLTACAPADKAEIGADAVVIDVRTNDEQASGYLEGALLLDINSGALESALPALDPNAEYLIYCRSGNRADQAIALMEQAGFTNLTNLGSLAQAASATGLPIVTADSSTPAPSATAQSLVTVAYADAYKSIFHLGQEQISTAVGIDLTASNTADVADALTDVSIWQSDPQTQPYADLIAAAFTREGDTTQEALHAVVSADDARLKIYVGHNDDVTVAHIQTEHDG